MDLPILAMPGSLEILVILFILFLIVIIGVIIGVIFYSDKKM